MIRWVQRVSQLPTLHTACLLCSSRHYSAAAAVLAGGPIGPMVPASPDFLGLLCTFTSGLSWALFRCSDPASPFLHDPFSPGVSSTAAEAATSPVASHGPRLKLLSATPSVSSSLNQLLTTAPACWPWKDFPGLDSSRKVKVLFPQILFFSKIF